MRPASGRGPGDGASGIGPSGAGGGISGDDSAAPSAMAARSALQSASERAIGPAWSSVTASGTIPAIGTRPCVGLIALMPDIAAGMRTDPAVSVPVAAGTIRAASAAADPPLDPPAERARSHGLPTWSVEPPKANSCVWVWPASTIPAAFRRAHTTESSVATLPSSIRLDAVTGRPATA